MNTILQIAPSGSTGFMSFILGVLICIGIFLLIRGIMLWYWKVNTIVENQEKTNQYLSSILRKLESRDESENIQT